jgi:hypothetical protein
MCNNSKTVDYIPKHLPNREYVKMTTEDQELVFNTLLKCKLGEKMVRLQRDNLNTNTVESRWKSTDCANIKGIIHTRLDQ